MSASLVGSEMCIRDSPVRLRPPAMGQDLRCLLVTQGVLAPEDAARAVPVSYTHLTLPTICSV
eukprot:1227293-Alexandrium_andersonii.AAC.1